MLFISYSTQDKDVVKKLVEQLKQHGFQIWSDWDAIEPGAQWQQSIEEGLNKASLLILMLSPDSHSSKWVDKEIQYAQQLGIPVIPFMIKAVKLPFKLNLQGVQYIDATKPEEAEAAFEKLLKWLATTKAKPETIKDAAEALQPKPVKARKEKKATVQETDKADVDKLKGRRDTQTQATSQSKQSVPPANHGQAIDNTTTQLAPDKVKASQETGKQARNQTQESAPPANHGQAIDATGSAPDPDSVEGNPHILVKSLIIFMTLFGVFQILGIDIGISSAVVGIVGFVVFGIAQVDTETKTFLIDSLEKFSTRSVFGFSLVLVIFLFSIMLLVRQNECLIPEGCETQTPIPSPEITETYTPESTALVSQTAEPTVTPSQTAEPTGTASQTTEPTGTASHTPEPTGTASQTSEPTATPSQTSEPTASPTLTTAPSATAVQSPTLVANATSVTDYLAPLLPFNDFDIMSRLVTQEDYKFYLSSTNSQEAYNYNLTGQGAEIVSWFSDSINRERAADFFRDSSSEARLGLVWQEAQLYCIWLGSLHEGGGIWTLPSFTELEYVEFAQGFSRSAEAEIVLEDLDAFRFLAPDMTATPYIAFRNDLQAGFRCLRRK